MTTALNPWMALGPTRHNILVSAPHCPRLLSSGAIGGLHLLPIYPSSGDGGFAPLTYKEVNEELGTWEDVMRLSKKYDLLMECMVNHISPASSEFQEFLEKGDQAHSADMWIDWQKFWPNGEGSFHRCGAKACTSFQGDQALGGGRPGWHMCLGLHQVYG